MPISCSYTYKGKTYSTDGIKRVIARELPQQDQEESIAFLSKTLNMTRDEIIIVSGLIDNKSLGRFKGDGRILLSDRSDLRTAKHEAFHKVWRMYLSPAERADAIRQFKVKRDWSKSLDIYRKYYPDLGDEDLIEEYFADEFETYQLQPETYQTQPLRSLFSRLLNFIKQVLGLRSGDVRLIYDSILGGKFKSKTPKIRYAKDADSIIIGSSELTVADKNAIVNFMTAKIINRVINKDVEAFSDLVEDLKWDAFNQMEAFLPVDLLDDIGDNLDSNGIVWQEVLTKLEFYGLTIFEKPVEKDLPAEDVEGEEVLGETSKTREYVAAIKVNPKDGLSARVKMLLASFTHPSNKSSIGLPETISSSSAFNQIATRMAGVPTKYFLEELEKLDLPYIKELLGKLGKTPDGWNNKDHQLRTEFVSKMALNENNFTFFQYGQTNGGQSEIRFSNLNSETREANLIRSWQTNLTVLTENITEDFEKQYPLYFKEKLSNLPRQVRERSHAIANILGIKFDERVLSEIAPHLNAIANLLLKGTRYKASANNIYERLDVGGHVNKIAKIQAKYEENMDLMINVLDTKIYALGLNTQQTIMVNKAKFLINKFKQEYSDTQDVLNRLRKEMPEMFNNWNMTLQDGRWKLQPLLAALYDGQFDITIPYAAKNEQGDEMYVDKMSEPELLSMHINGAMTGNFMSMKHSDRSTFFAYKTLPLIEYTDIITNSNDTDNLGIRYVVNGLIKEIQKEVEFAQSEYSDLPMQYIGNKAKLSTGYSKLLSSTRLDELIQGDTINDTDKQKLYKMVEDDFKKFLSIAQENGLYEEGVHIAGLNPTVIAEFNKRNLPDTGSTAGFKNSAIRMSLLYAYVNEHLFHMGESRLFTGDNRMFKSANDLYKRLATQSSNGLLASTDDATNRIIRSELDVDYEVFDVTTGQVIKINTAEDLLDTQIRGVTLKEESNYKARLLEPSGKPSKLGLDNPSKLASIMEWGFLQDFPNPTEDQKTKILKKIEQAESKYGEVNENDGQSYMTLPAFKNYQMRFGLWTDEMDVAYQIEMALLGYKNLMDAKDLEITITGKNKYAGKVIKPFEITKSFTKRDDYKLEAMHTLKVQYAGPSIQEAFAKGRDELDYSFFSVFKTSNHLLQPSAIIGTNLQSMNVAMLKSNVQVVHMGSANKVGGVDPSLAAKQIPEDDTRFNDERTKSIASKGLTFYKDGAFNHDEFVFSSNSKDGFANYLFNWEYYKDQVKIGNKEKDEISGSTQSLKILLSNLIINGKERFPGALDIVTRYKEVVDKIVKANSDALLDELGNDEVFYTNLKNVVMQSSQVKSGSDNLKNVISNFFDDPVGIEKLTLRQKIENVLYSLVTNNVIAFDRAGNSYPQAAATGYEPYGSRKMVDGGYQSQELDFYEPVFDDDGNLLKIKPAEIIIPLPTKWVPKLLKFAGTNNLIEALDILNKKVAESKENDDDLFIVKGLRIPNQQLSSNDMFRIKKFTLPTVQSYAIVPSEIVIKVGSDSIL